MTRCRRADASQPPFQRATTLLLRLDLLSPLQRINSLTATWGLSPHTKNNIKYCQRILLLHSLTVNHCHVQRRHCCEMSFSAWQLLRRAGAAQRLVYHHDRHALHAMPCQWHAGESNMQDAFMSKSNCWK